MILESGHSRVPVFDTSVDQTLGVIYVKDLLMVFRNQNKQNSLRDLLRPAYFIPEAKHLDSLLAEMQSQRIHIAIVVDEYGGVAGMVTLEDIVEEIVGEIQDEYDQGEESPYQVLANGDFIFQGRIDLDDFNKLMGSNLQKDEADTIGGYIYSHLGRIPTVGDEVKTDDLLLTVEQVTARRIRKVRGRWLRKESEQLNESEDETDDPD
jgi:putative hemolysin